MAGWPQVTRKLVSWHSFLSKSTILEKFSAFCGNYEKLMEISPGDFPDIKRMKEQLMHQDFTKFRQLDMKLLQKVYDFFVFPNTVYRI